MFLVRGKEPVLWENRFLHVKSHHWEFSKGYGTWPQEFFWGHFNNALTLYSRYIFLCLIPWTWIYPFHECKLFIYMLVLSLGKLLIVVWRVLQRGIDLQRRTTNILEKLCVRNPAFAFSFFELCEVRQGLSSLRS